MKAFPYISMIVLLLTACVDNGPNIQVVDEAAVENTLDELMQEVHGSTHELNKVYRLTDDGSAAVPYIGFDVENDTTLAYIDMADNYRQHSKEVVTAIYPYLKDSTGYKHMMVEYRFAYPVERKVGKRKETYNSLTFEYRTRGFLLVPSPDY